MQASSYACINRHRKQGEGVVLRRVGIFSSLCPEKGQSSKPSAASLSDLSALLDLFWSTQFLSGNQFQLVCQTGLSQSREERCG